MNNWKSCLSALCASVLQSHCPLMLLFIIYHNSSDDLGYFRAFAHSVCQASHKDFSVFEEVPQVPTVGRGLPAHVACPGLATGLAFKGLVSTSLWLWERKGSTVCKAG